MQYGLLSALVAENTKKEESKMIDNVFCKQCGRMFYRFKNYAQVQDGYICSKACYQPWDEKRDRKIAREKQNDSAHKD
jgi:hypothetical protein